MRNLTHDSLAIVLLCSRLGLPEQAGEVTKPLSVSEWNRLARSIAASEWKRPGAVMGKMAEDLRRVLGLDDQMAKRVASLLDRGGQLAIELERLEARGIWIRTRADETYPSKLKNRLGSAAPPVLFGAGTGELLAHNGLAVVGSRDVDAPGTRFAASLGQRCAEARLTVFSGAARGVDRIAMVAAMENSGTAVGVVADSLERLIRDREYRNHILQGRLALVTPFSPSARFSVGNAMARNKVVYCLADFAVVVAASSANGGTWAGAIENQERGWIPLFVRSAPDVPEGNRELMVRGGIPLCESSLPKEDTFLTWLKEQVATRRKGPDRERLALEPTALAGRQPLEGSPATPVRDAKPSSPLAAHVDHALFPPQDLFPANWQHIEPFLQEPRREQEIAEAFCLESVQVRKWLERAVHEGLARKTNRPVRYHSTRSQNANGQQLTLAMKPPGQQVGA